MTKAVSILVCGGRDFNNISFLKSRLEDFCCYIYDKFDEEVNIVIHGAAKGADTLAESWAKSKAIKYVGVPANWNEHGMSAGPIRNKVMLDLDPDYVIGFDGGKGTANMLSIAKAKGTKTFHIKSAS